MFKTSESKQRLTVVALSLVLAFPSLFFFLHKDACVFLLGGRSIAAGEVLYRDLWDLKPPLIYLFSAFPALFDSSQQIFVFYCINCILLGLTVYFLCSLSQRYANIWVGAMASFIYITVMLTSAGTSLGQCETWANVFGLAAVWLWLRKDENLFFSVSSGFCLGMIVFLKITCLLPFIPLLFIEKRSQKHWLSLLTGSSLALLAVVGWLFWSGSWIYFQEIQRRFLFPYTQITKTDLSGRLWWMYNNVLGWFILLFVPSLFALYGMAEKKTWISKVRLVLVISFCFSVLCIWIQKRGVVYQWQVAAPVFSLLAASGFSAFYSRLKLKNHLFPTALVLMWSLYASRDLWQAFVWQPHPAARLAVTSQRNLVGENWADSLSCAHYLKARRRPNDRLFAWGFEPSLYIYSDIEPANRFVYTAALSATFAPVHWQKEAWDSLKNQEVRFVVVQNSTDLSELGSPRADIATLWRKTPIFPWFKQNYRLVKTFGKLEIYEKGAAPLN